MPSALDVGLDRQSHELEKICGGFVNDQATWQLTYTPGTVDTDYPVTLLDSWDNSTHVLVPESLVAMQGGEDITHLIVQHHVAGSSGLAIQFEQYSPEPVSISYATRLADERMAVQSASDLLLANIASVVDASTVNLTTPVTCETTAPASSRIMSRKVGAQSGRHMNWTLTFSPHERALSGGLSVSDTLPEGLLLTGIYSLSVTGGGTPEHSFVIAPDNKSYSLSIDAPLDPVGYTLGFGTVVDDAYFDQSLTASFTNVADVLFDWEAYDPDGYPTGVPTATSQSPQTTAPLEARAIAKTGSYDRSRGVITWAVTVNPYGVNLLGGRITEDLSIETAYPSTYVAGSFATTSSDLSFDSVASTDQVIYVDVGDIGSASPTFTFETQLTNPEHYAGNFAYGSGGTLTSMTYYNTIALTGSVLAAEATTPDAVSTTYRGSASGVTSRMIDKRAVGYNPATGSISWQMVVNANAMHMTNVLIDDTMSLGQAFDRNSVRINGVATDANWTVTQISDTHFQLAATQLDTVTTLTFNTSLRPDSNSVFLTLAQVELCNQATLTHDTAPDVVLTVSDCITIDNQIIAKTGVFDTANKVVHYSVAINPNAMTIADAYVLDNIPTGLQLDITSVTLYHATVDSSGNFSAGAVCYGYDDPSFAYTDRSFTMQVPTTGRYLLTFDCYITTYYPVYENVITLHDNNGQIAEAPAESAFEVPVDPSSTGTSSQRVKLFVDMADSLRPELKLGGVELTLYQTIGITLVPIMTVTTDAQGQAFFYPLKEGVSYSIEQTGAITGYSSKVLTHGAQTDLTFTPIGNSQFGVSINPSPSSQELHLALYSEAVRGSVNFAKTSDRALKGVFELMSDMDTAVFTFTDLSVGSSYVETAVIGVSGCIDVALPFGDYAVSETTTPAYHATASDFALSIDALTGAVTGVPQQAGRNEVRNVYYRPSYPLYKTDSDGNPMGGVTFDLYDTSDTPRTLVDTVTTDSDGLAQFDNLYGGKTYEIQERPAPSLPVPNPTATPYGNPATNAPLNTCYYLPAPPLSIPTVNQASDYTRQTFINYQHAATLLIRSVDVMRLNVPVRGTTFTLWTDNPADNPLATPISFWMYSDSTHTYTLDTVNHGLWPDGYIAFPGLALEQDVPNTLLGQEPPLLPTSYWLQVVAPEGGYNLADSRYITLDPAVALSAGQEPRTYTYPYTLTNDPTYHADISLTFLKTTDKAAPYTYDPTENTPLPNRWFLMEDATYGSDLCRWAQSGPDGMTTFTDIPFGNYRLREVNNNNSKTPQAATGHSYPFSASASASDNFIEIDFNREGQCYRFGDLFHPNPDNPDYSYADLPLTPEELATLKVVNHILKYAPVINKWTGSTTNYLSGMSFEMLDESQNSFDPPRISSLTDASGKADFSALPLPTAPQVMLYGDPYYLREVVNPYPNLYRSEWHVTSSSTTSISWRSLPFAASIKLTNYDTRTGAVIIENMGYSLYPSIDDPANPGVLIPDLSGTRLTGTTDGTGVFTFTGLGLEQSGYALNSAEPTLLATTYFVVQGSSPHAGYSVNNTPVPVTLTAGSTTAIRTQVQNIAIYNDPRTVNLDFITYSDKYAPYTLADPLASPSLPYPPLAGVTFTLVDQTSGSELVYTAQSGLDGMVHFDNIPFGTYRLYEGTPTVVGPAPFHNPIDDDPAQNYVVVAFDTNGQCTEFNAVTSPEGIDSFFILNHVYQSSLTVTLTDPDGTLIGGVPFALYTADGQPIDGGTVATTGSNPLASEYGQITFMGLLGGDTYLVRPVNNPLTGYYQTGDYTLTIDTQGNYQHTWVNYPYAAGISVTISDAYTHAPVPDALVALYASTPDGTQPQGSPIAYGTTDSNGNFVFTSLPLGQDLTATLGTDSEPILLPTTYWVEQLGGPDTYHPAVGLFRVDFEATDRTAIKTLAISNYTTQAPTLHLHSGAHRVPPHQSVKFSEVIADNGQITYDPDTGVFTLLQPATYYVAWYVAVATGLSHDKNNFSLMVADPLAAFEPDTPPSYMASSPFVPSQTKGFAIVQVADDSAPHSFSLVNNSEHTATLSRRVQANAALSIARIATLRQNAYPTARMELQLGTDTLLTAGQTVNFAQILTPTRLQGAIQYESATGYLYVQPGRYLLRWELPIIPMADDGTGQPDTAQLALYQLSPLSQTWLTYKALPTAPLVGSVFVESRQLATFKLALDADSDALKLSGYGTISMVALPRNAH